MKECIYCGKLMKVNGTSHQLYCKENPNRKTREGKSNPMFGKKGSNQYKDGLKMPIETKLKIAAKAKLQIVSEETKLKISNSMKQAHAEGRAWNIGQSRWNNKPSYPELFFMEVIENEFKDKNYIREYPIGIYSIDFAWPEKKLAIEIDGSQHERFKEYKNRDNKKDKFLIENNWNVLRIKWKDLFNNTNKYITIAKNFIN